MSKSGRPGLGDVRRALRVVGECRDLGHDPAAWWPHAFEGVGKLLGARGATGGGVTWVRPDGVVRYAHPVVTGFSAAEVAVFARFVRERDPAGDPALGPLGRIPGQFVTRTRRQLVGDPAWYGSVSFNEYRKPAGADHCLYSLFGRPAADRYSLIGLHRPVGDRPFGGRERRLLHLFHAELGRLIGPVLVSPDDPLSPTRLPPRVRQVLSCLLDGDSEKQVAVRLGLSGPTVHQYVTALYRHYAVASRAELLARVLRRARPGGQST